MLFNSAVQNNSQKKINFKLALSLSLCNLLNHILIHDCDAKCSVMVSATEHRLFFLRNYLKSALLHS